MTDFIKVERRKQSMKSFKSQPISTATKLQNLQTQLSKYQTILQTSPLYQHIKTTLQTQILPSTSNLKQTISKIRCLALGSPSSDHAAMFQLAMLVLLQKDLNIESQQVSLYDPVFEELDLLILTGKEELNYKVEEQYEDQSPERETNADQITLYFLPHAPLSLTNIIFSANKPRLLLSNNIITHVDRLTKSELFEKYPLVGKFVSLVKEVRVEQQETEEQEKQNDTAVDDDGFQKYHSSKRKANNSNHTSMQNKKKNFKSKLKYIEKQIDYSNTESYFNNIIKLWSFKKFEESDEWLNAFTDLSLHYVVS